MTDLPLRFVLFGGTGDLVRKKIIPAIFDLYQSGMVQEDFEILGVSRKKISDDEFRNFIKESLELKKYSGELVEKFIQKSNYFSADISDKSTLDDLVSRLNRVPGNNLYYLAISPLLYENAFKNIAESGFMNPLNGWDRILVEKPFGNNLEHAKFLDSLLGDLFKENQIFRIDHYLAKETLQNILTFRFANSIFEPSWNSDSINEIHVKMYESFDVDNRAAFYDSVGALRDVGQNHVLQMLALVAMEEPKDLSFESVRGQRAAVLESMDLPEDFSSPEQLSKLSDAPRAQYIGYNQINGIPSDSKTETFFSIPIKIKNKKWENTKFFISSGKALKETFTEIEVIFKEKGDGIKNTITFKVQPEQKIIVQFWYKQNGFDYKVSSKELIFEYEKDKRTPDAYEKVLFDAIKGDQTLFISTREIMAQWFFVEKVLKTWDKMPIFQYKKGIDPSENLSTI
jgi:glucose-6-phosphate 1-dehydrogenase